MGGTRTGLARSFLLSMDTHTLVYQRIAWYGWEGVIGKGVKSHCGTSLAKKKPVNERSYQFQNLGDKHGAMCM